MEILIFILSLIPYGIVGFLAGSKKQNPRKTFILLIFMCIYIPVDNYFIPDYKGKCGKTTLIYQMEYAYSEGQIDAINNDFSVSQHLYLNDTLYNWSKSPWNNKQQPIYNFEDHE